MDKYRKKPVVIHAVQLSMNNMAEVMEQMKADAYEVSHHSPPPIRAVTGVAIKTLEGTMFASFGDYIIKGVQGEYYPCKPDIFLKTYEVVS